MTISRIFLLQINIFLIYGGYLEMAQKVRDFEMAHFQISSKSRSRGKLPRFQKKFISRYWMLRIWNLFKIWGLKKWVISEFRHVIEILSQFESEPSQNLMHMPSQHLIGWLFEPSQGGNDPTTFRFIETKNQILKTKTNAQGYSVR